MDSVYHRGEIAVQQMAGALTTAEQTSRSVRDYMPQAASEFLANQTFIIISTIDNNNRVWATLLTGAPGFDGSFKDIRIKSSRMPPRGTCGYLLREAGRIGC